MSQNTFSEFFSQIYAERWPKLLAALQAKPRQEGLNPFGCADEPYFLDAASIVAARALPISPGHAVLDLCAAPGGKSLVLAERIKDAGTLVANERSATRRARLKRVLEEYLPEELLRRVRITGHDASKWCIYEKDAYDAILLDAPCSSERHLIAQPKLLAEWTPNRTRFLAQRQYAMLASALQVVRVDGHVLYATCSISPFENDGVIEKLIKKRGEKISVIPPSAPFGESTRYGWLILPDTTEFGPLYFALIKREC